MKKIILFFIFLSNYSYAQITVSGSPNPNINGVYSPVASVPILDCYLTFNDAGTNVYQKSIIIPASGGAPAYRMEYYISRRNNRWFIEGFSYLSAPYTYYPYYVSNTTSTDTNPSCINVWQIWTGSCFPLGAFSIAYTGTTTSAVVLSGYCTCPVSLSTTLYPSYIQLPLLNAPSLLAISPPQKGMLTFSMDTHRAKIYDGFQWANLVQDKGNVTLGGSLTASGLNSSGSVTTPMNVFTTSFTVDATMHHIFYAGSGGHNCTLPSSIAITGREYIIANHGGGSLTFSQSIKTGLSTSINSSVPGFTLHIIFDGTQWRLIN